MKNLVLIALIGIAVTSCSKEPENLMSPCVGAKGSPCDRTPVNQLGAQQNIKV